MCVNKNYTYADYLERWEGHFGDAQTAEALGLVNGQQRTVVLYKLPEDQFNWRLEKLINLNEHAEAAFEHRDWATYEASLAAMVTYEAVLLMGTPWD